MDKTVKTVTRETDKKKKRRTFKGTPPDIVKPVGSAKAATREKVYMRGLRLESIEDVDLIKREVRSGNILIIKLTPLAIRRIGDVALVVRELRKFTKSLGGDIARIGEERIIITPPSIKIWRARADTSIS